MLTHFTQDVEASHAVPIKENGNVSALRTKSVDFEELPTTVARTVGHVMLWVVIACSNEVDRVRRQSLQNPNATNWVQECTQIARDVMVFAGLIRYKLPGRVWETLARAGQDLGAF